MESVELLRILDSIKELSNRVESLYQEKSRPSIPNKSEVLNELFSALSKAQADIKIAGLSNENPFFKSRYSDLAEIVKVSRGPLAKNGLSIIQQILPNDDGQNILHTILAHSSGQWIESRMRIIPLKPDVQSLGSYITYLKRYSLASLIGVVSGDEDDDGELAVYDQREVAAKGVALNLKYNPKEQSYETITKEQLEEAQYELQGYVDIAEQVLDGLKIQSIADMPKSKFQTAMNRIRAIKNTRNGIR
jgi:ElaB/YqjD/DUF883 family membrane-anchored ribosome-binding protein